jgi:nitroimidazol reductase NimA-like FMN-containing flavoprotein (pyridoxamine 5'-phosphate oxidase superfamily)
MVEVGSVTFTKSEQRFLRSNEVGRLATISRNGTPHVVPVSYIFKDNAFLIAVDYGTKKLRNIRRNRRTALVVDTIGPNRGILIQGNARLIVHGTKFRQAYSQFHRAFSWVRADPWKEGEAPFVKIMPDTKASWGFR